MADNASIPLQSEQGAKPTILVVASDLKMLKLLKMALLAEFECDVLTMSSGRNVVETATRVTPDLMMLDAHLLDGHALALSDQLHTIGELATMPTILINVQAASMCTHQEDHTIALQGPFVLVDVYAAVHRCLSRA